VPTPPWPLARARGPWHSALAHAWPLPAAAAAAACWPAAACCLPGTAAAACCLLLLGRWVDWRLRWWHCQWWAEPRSRGGRRQPRIGLRLMSSADDDEEDSEQKPLTDVSFLATLCPSPQWLDVLGIGDGVFLRLDSSTEPLRAAAPASGRLVLRIHAVGRVLQAPGQQDERGSGGAQPFLDTRSGVGMEGSPAYVPAASGGEPEPIGISVGEQDAQGSPLPCSHPLLPHGLLLAVRRLLRDGRRDGEVTVPRATVRIEQRFGYGEDGWPPGGVGACEALEYEVEVVEVEVPGTEDAAAAVARHAEQWKLWGNGWFRAGLHERAARCYRSGLQALGPPPPPPPSTQNTARADAAAANAHTVTSRKQQQQQQQQLGVGVALGSNLAKAEERRGRPTSALQALAEVLERDPTHLRALVSRCRLCTVLGDLGTAQQMLERAVALAPAEPDVCKVQRKLRAAQKAEQRALKVSRSCACIGSPCLRYCVHGASIGHMGGQACGEASEARPARRHPDCAKGRASARCCQLAQGRRG
jgi:hypothetical protein